MNKFSQELFEKNRTTKDTFNDADYKRRVYQVRKCDKCGHSVDYRMNVTYIICSHCGNKIYKIKFKNILQDKLKKGDK